MKNVKNFLPHLFTVAVILQFNVSTGPNFQAISTAHTQTKVVFSDTCVFSDDFETDPQGRWQVNVRGSSNGPNGIEQTVRYEASAGNPGGFRAMTHSIDGDGNILVAHMYTEQYYLPSEQGAIASLTYSEDRLSFDGKAVGSRVVVWQRGQVHTAPLPTFNEQAWSTEMAPSLTEVDFTPVPDFSTSGDTLWFGYERNNTNTNPNAVRLNDHGIDNWQVTIYPAVPPPAVACTLEPATATARLQKEHKVTATVEINGQPAGSGIDVNFAVTSGPNVGESDTWNTNEDGQAVDDYLGRGGTGTDVIEASGTFDGVNFSCTAQVTWVPNRAPVANPDKFIVSHEAGSKVLTVLANDFDPDGDRIRVSHVTQPVSGGVSIAAGGIEYSNGGEIIEDFTYTIEDVDAFPILSDSTGVLVMIDCGCTILCIFGQSIALKPTQQDTIDLDLLRRVRDQIMAPSEHGARYVDFYYNSTPEIAELLIVDRPDLGAQAVTMVELMQPALRSLLDGDGSAIFTQTLTDTIGSFFANLSAAGSDSLQQLIADELARVGPLDGYVGMAVRDVINIALADSVATSIRDDSQTLPVDFVLEQNYPNPFNPSTSIRYSLSEASEIELSIFNIQGRKIKTLVKTRQQAGNYRAVFDSDGLASGMYFYRLRTERFVETRKMLLLQ